MVGRPAQAAGTGQWSFGSRSGRKSHRYHGTQPRTHIAPSAALAVYLARSSSAGHGTARTIRQDGRNLKRAAGTMGPMMDTCSNRYHGAQHGYIQLSCTRSLFSTVIKCRARHGTGHSAESERAAGTMGPTTGTHSSLSCTRGLFSTVLKCRARHGPFGRTAETLREQPVPWDPPRIHAATDTMGPSTGT